MSKVSAERTFDPRTAPKPESKPEPKPAPAGQTRAEGSPWSTRIFVRDLVLSCRIGIHQHERVAPQRIRLNVDLDFRPDGPIEDDLDSVVCYSELVTGIRHAAGAGHVNLAETLAERIAAMCLEDARVRRVRVRVEKLDVFAEAESVGVEIERRQPEA